MKRTIEEVITLYELEPVTRKDVYVEGESDRELLSWCFDIAGQSQRAIYPIDLVEVPSALVAQNGLNLGSNRSRVITMALEVWKEIDKESCELSFVVDQDLCQFVEEQLPPNGVLLTDCAAMDSYLLQSDSLVRYARFVCCVQADHVGSFVSSLFEVVRSMFSLRLTLCRLGISAKLVGVDRVLSFVNGQMSIDMVELVRRTLSASNGLGRAEDVSTSLKAAIEEVKGKDASGRIFVNGHDLTLVLGEAALRLGRDSAYREEARVRKALLMALRYEDLAAEPLFAKLLAA